MEDVVTYCPNCHGRLLSADAPILDHAPQRVTGGAVFYCPSCEMFVEPAKARPGEGTTLETIDPGQTPENRGRPRAAGSNAGGSQRGDLSDEGASQWRKDPQEAERNTWKQK